MVQRDGSIWFYEAASIPCVLNHLLLLWQQPLLLLLLQVGGELQQLSGLSRSGGSAGERPGFAPLAVPPDV